MGDFETFEFETADGLSCNLKHPLGQQPTKGPVLLVHGAGVRGNIFIELGTFPIPKKWLY